MDLKNIVKGKTGELLLLFFIPLFFFYLIPFPYYFVAIIISWVGSLSIMYYRRKEEILFDKYCAKQGFILSFFSQLCQQATFKQAYEISIKYLNSYYQLQTFEEMLKDPSIYNLDSEESFLYALEKEKNNEGLIPNYSYLYEEKAKQYNRIMEAKEKREKNHNIVITSFCVGVLAIALIMIMFSNILKSLNSIYYLLGSLIGLSLPLPLLELDLFLKTKKERQK